MSECPSEPDGAVVEAAMLEWWNNSFVQMQDRITVRDRMLQGV
jgi:hypothetical protein